MEVSGTALQQASTQTALGMAMLKKNAQAEKSLVNMIDQAVQSAPGARRGQNLDITV